MSTVTDKLTYTGANQSVTAVLWQNIPCQAGTLDSIEIFIPATITGDTVFTVYKKAWNGSSFSSIGTITVASGTYTDDLTSLANACVKGDSLQIALTTLPTGQILYSGIDLYINYTATVDADTLGGTSAANFLTVGKQTIYIPASGMTPATTSGPAAAQLESSSNKVNYPVLDFDGATDESAHFNVAFPKSWNEGTITYQVFWSSTATDTDAVVWGLQGIALSDNEAIDTAFGTAVTVTDNVQSGAGELYVSSESSAVTIGGSPAAGDLVFFRFYRDADNGSDTASEDARLIGIKLFYTTDAATDA